MRKNVKGCWGMLCLLLLQMAPVAAQKPQTFTINGKIDGLPDGTRVTMYNAVGAAQRGDSITDAIINKGAFTLAGKLHGEGDFYLLAVPQNSSQYLRLYVDETPVTITGQFYKWPRLQVKGSSLNNDYFAWLELNDKITAPRDSILQSSLRLQEALRFKANKIMMENRLAYIDQHPDGIYTAFLIRYTPALDVDAKKLAYDRLTDKVKKSFFARELLKFINAAKGNQTLAIGNKAPDFTSLTPDGKELSLQQVVGEGKLTLIDFWASWCGPCRDETPAVKKVYDEFHAKGFNVLSVSLDTKAENWKAAIEKDKMNWYHVSELKGPTFSHLAVLYGAGSIPKTFLVDEKGNLVASDLRGEKLYEKVKSMLSE